MSDSDEDMSTSASSSGSVQDRINAILDTESDSSPEVSDVELNASDEEPAVNIRVSDSEDSDEELALHNRMSDSEDSVQMVVNSSSSSSSISSLSSNSSSMDRDSEERASLELVQGLKKAVTIGNPPGSMPVAPAFTGQVNVADAPLHTITFADLQLIPLEEVYKNKPNFRHVMNFLIGKQKGEETEKCAFSVFLGRRLSGRRAEARFFIKVDAELLSKIKSSLKSPSISLQVEIDMPSFALPRAMPFTFRQAIPSSTMQFKTKGSPAKLDDLLDFAPVETLELRCVAPSRSKHFRAALHEHLLKEAPRVLSWTISIHCDTSLVERGPWKISSASVLQDLYALDNSTKDVSIVAANGSEIKCHRIILMVRSPSLHSMLTPTCKMMEAQTGRLELAQNSADGLEEFVKCLYGFEIPVERITPDVAFELFQLANKYQVKELESMMKAFLLEKRMNYLGPDVCLELYFYVRNVAVESFEELRVHSLIELTTLSEEALKSCDYFKTLEKDNAVDLLFKLMKWK